MRTPRNADNSTGTAQYFAFVGRVVRSYGKKARAGEVDSTALTQLRELRALLDEQEAEVVAALRTEQGGSHSWQEIADGLGIARSAAIRKFGHSAPGARRAGGQPAHMR